MSEHHRSSSRARGLLIGIGGRAAATTLRPVAGMIGAAASVGVVVERRAVDRLLDSSELERALNLAVDSVKIQASLERALQSDGVKRLVDGLFDTGLLEQVIARMFDTGLLDRAIARMFDSGQLDRAIERMFESGAFDRLLDQVFESGGFDRMLARVLASDGLWDLVDVVAASPAVSAAISQQGLGFADQLGDEVRARSRKADDWVERTARRLMHRPPRVLPPEPDAGM